MSHLSFHVYQACQRLSNELDLQSLFGLHVRNYTHWLRPCNPPPPSIWAHIRGRYWSANIDDISLWLPEAISWNYILVIVVKKHHKLYTARNSFPKIKPLVFIAPTPTRILHPVWKKWDLKKRKKTERIPGWPHSGKLSANKWSSGQFPNPP